MKNIKKVLIMIPFLTSIACIFGMTELPFNFAGLPKDMQDEIVLQYVKSVMRDLSQKVTKIRQKEKDDLEKASLEDVDFDPFEITEESKKERINALTEGLKRINNLVLTNKELSKKMNEARFTYRLIVTLEELFNLPDEVIAKALATKAAQDRIQLQKDFLALFYPGVQFSQMKFDDFIKKGVDLEWGEGDYGWTPLFHAVMNNKLAAIKALVKAGVDINYKNDYNQQTALSLMVQQGRGSNFPINQRIEIMKFFIGAGADVFATDSLKQVEDPKNRAFLKKEVVDTIKQAQLNVRNYVPYVQPRPRHRTINLKFVE
jgi:hypothetical protein